jgi:integrase
LAYEWKLIPRLPKIRRLPGEKGREFVLTGEMETAYLAAIDYPLRQAAILMLDLGLRPEECVSLRKTDINTATATAGNEAIGIASPRTPRMIDLAMSASADSLTVRSGKTANAARSLPLTDRAREVIDLLCKLWPDSEWLFPGWKKGSHLTRAHLDHLHQAARAKNGWPLQFVLYSCRHTYATRLAESGANNLEIMRLMGHSSITVSQRYIHLSAQHLMVAAKRAENFSKMLRGEEVHSDTSPVSKE